MKLKKITILVTAALLMVSSCAGCSIVKKDVKEQETSELKEKTFSEIIVDTSQLKNYSYTGEIFVSLNNPESVENKISAFLQDTQLKEIYNTVLSVLEISDFQKGVTLVLTGAVKDGNWTIEASVKAGDTITALTDLIVINDNIYLNIKKIINVIDNISSKMGQNIDVQLDNVLPKEEYIKIPMNDIVETKTLDESESKNNFNISSVVNLFPGMPAINVSNICDNLNNLDSNSIKESSMYLLDEFVKAAKEAGIYTEEKGYHFSVNKDNIIDLDKNFFKTLLEDADEIQKNVKLLMGNEFVVSADDIKQYCNNMTDEKLNALAENMKISLNLDVTVNKDSTTYILNEETEDEKVTISLLLTEKDNSIESPASSINFKDFFAENDNENLN